MATRCEAFGHSYSFWKEGGKSYLRCDYCGDVQPIGPIGVTAPAPNVIDFNERLRQKDLEYDRKLYAGILDSDQASKSLVPVR